MSASVIVERVWAHISAERLLQSTYRFVDTPSPTGSEAAFARVYADHLRARITELAPLNVVTDVRGKGLLIGMGLARDAASGVPFAPSLRFGQRVAKRALAKGLILRADPDWIALAPPLVITQEEADILFDTLAESLREELAELRQQGLA